MHLNHIGDVSGRQTGSADWRSARGEAGSALSAPPPTTKATRYRRTGDQLGAFVRASGENPPRELAVNVRNSHSKVYDMASRVGTV
jgi:hypothetical protein